MPPMHDIQIGKSKFTVPKLTAGQQIQWAQFCLHQSCGKFHFGHMETPKTSKFVPQKWILARGSKGRRTQGQEGVALRGRKGAHLSRRRPFFDSSIFQAKHTSEFCWQIAPTFLQHLRLCQIPSIVRVRKRRGIFGLFAQNSLQTGSPIWQRLVKMKKVRKK